MIGVQALQPAVHGRESDNLSAACERAVGGLQQLLCQCPDDVEQRFPGAAIQQARLDPPRTLSVEIDRWLTYVARELHFILRTPVREVIEPQVNAVIDFVKRHRRWWRRFFGKPAIRYEAPIAHCMMDQRGRQPGESDVEHEERVNLALRDPVVTAILPLDKKKKARAIQRPHWTAIGYLYLLKYGDSADWSLVHISPTAAKLAVHLLAKCLNGGGQTLRYAAYIRQAIELAIEDLSGAIPPADAGDPAAGSREAASAASATAGADDSTAAEPDAGPARRGPGFGGRVEWLSRAMLLVNEHPDWSDAKIARQVDKHPSTLTRDQFYQAAAKLARDRGGRLRRGHVEADLDTGARGVEAYDDDVA